MKKKLLFALAIASLAMTSVAFAEDVTTTSETSKTNLQTQREELRGRRAEIRDERVASAEERQTARQAKRDESIEQRCARIQERVMERSANFEGRKNGHMAVYENMTNRISKFIERLSGQGYDVSKIQADLVVLKEKIQKFSTDFAAQAAKLGETKNLACGHSDGEFRSGLLGVRTMMQGVRADAMDIRKYMLNTVRPDIQALRKQKIEEKKVVNTDKATEVEKPELEQ